MHEREGRTLPLVVEREEDACEIIAKRVAKGSTVYADEATCWDALHARFDTQRINHSSAFSDGGACTNQAESYLNRVQFEVHSFLCGSG